MLLPTALASMIDIGVAGENRNTILIIAAVMATLAILAVFQHGSHGAVRQGVH